MSASLRAMRAWMAAQSVQPVDGAWSQAVAARLLPRVVLLLDDEHVDARAREPVRGRGAGRPTAHDKDVALPPVWAGRLQLRRKTIRWRHASMIGGRPATVPDMLARNVRGRTPF